MEISFLTHNLFNQDDDFRIRYPQENHINKLIQLSASFAAENDWAVTLPVGQITSEEEARQYLFGPDVIISLIAESQSGELVGFISLYRGSEPDYLSISLLVTASCRRGGLARRLVETAFTRLPAGQYVRMCVDDNSHPSLIAATRLGFQFERAVEENGHIIHIFIRKT